MILKVQGIEVGSKKQSKNDKKKVKMGGRVGIGFSSILVGLEGQVGRPNPARRGPKHDLTGQGRPRQDKRPRQASQVQSSQERRARTSLVLGREGFTLP